MKTRKFQFTFLLMAVVLMVSLACGGTTVTTSEPVEPATNEPTDAITEEPTEQATDEPTEAPTEAPVEQYFTEEFNSDPGWAYTVLGPGSSSSESQAQVEFGDGLMKFDITSEQLYAYYIYEDQSYEDVRLDLRFENRGVNSQAVSLICRLSDEGWYLLTFNSSGMWQLWAYVTSDNGYRLLQSGGSTAIKQGKAVNEYGMSCDGNKISVFINGVEPKGTPITENKVDFRRGTVGFAVLSFNSLPVKVEVDWFKISAP